MLPVGENELVRLRTPGQESVDREFVLEGFKWGSSTQGTPGGTVTWSLAQNNYVGRWTFDYTLTGLGFDPEPVIQQAFDAWSAVANIDFVQVADSSTAGIRFGMNDDDGMFGTLAVAHTAFTGGSVDFTDIHYDTAENWTPMDGSGGNISFLSVTIHEIGHSLGLDHEDDVIAVMNSLQNQFGPTLNSLQSDDIAGIQTIYGAAATGAGIVGTEGNDALTGTANGESIQALGGHDLVFGLGGSDNIFGDAGEDLIYGNPGNDLIYGNQGLDTIYGGQDGDVIYAGQHADIAYGNLANDVIYGNFDQDTLYGGQDQDTLYGGQGDDQIFGNLGNDDLYGNLGNDWLVGGDGEDWFYFANNSGADVIADYNTFLDLVIITANANGSGIFTAADAVARLSDTVDGAVLDLGGGNSVLFLGLTTADLGTDDFAIF